MSEIDRGPEHQCGGPQEGCCIPGCPECRMPVAATSDNLDAESAAFVAHRCWTYEALLNRIAELEARIAESDSETEEARAVARRWHANWQSLAQPVATWHADEAAIASWGAHPLALKLTIAELTTKLEEAYGAFRDALKLERELRAHIAELESRRPVVCETCRGTRFVFLDPCPECGKDGCGPGVRWEVKP